MLFNTLQMSVRCLRCANVLPLKNIKTTIGPRRYGSWLHRRPIAVINEEIVLDESEATPVPRKYVDEDTEHVPLKARKHKRAGQGKHPLPPPPKNTTYKADGSLNHDTILGDDRKLAGLMMTIRSKKMRTKTNQILIEGLRLISDALHSGLKPKIILFSRVPDAMKLPLPTSGVQVIKVPYKTIQLWSSLTTAPGIMGVFELPETCERELTKDSIPLTIVCDNVREPGNLGAILRAAAGVGCERIILMKGCVDLWDSKVLRSAAGAHFRVSVSHSVEWEDIDSLISPTASIYAADNNVVVGSEVESGTEAHSDEEEGSDYEDDDELTNSAGKDRHADEKSAPLVKYGATERNAENRRKIWSPRDQSADEEKKQSVNNEEADPEGNYGRVKVRKVSMKDLTNRLPIIPYYAADFTNNEVVLIVGGETHGLSYESIELMREKSGVRLNVPLTNGVESLNTGMALGIVAFEVKKQFLISRDLLVKK